MSYVDGYVLPVPSDRVAEYRKIAAKASKVWVDHGALEYRECAAEDLNVPFGVPFSKMMKLKEGETVIFAFIVFKSRKDRDRVNAAVMKDPRLANMDCSNMPFEPKRMVYGGFKTIVERFASNEEGKD